MPLIVPFIDRHFEHQIWQEYGKEFLAEYTRQRMLHCTPTQVLELFFRAPICEDCIPDDPFRWGDAPSITARNWREDTLLELGESAYDSIVALWG